jgi:hypothetical protein
MADSQVSMGRVTSLGHERSLGLKHSLGSGASLGASLNEVCDGVRSQLVGSLRKIDSVVVKTLHTDSMMLHDDEII